MNILRSIYNCIIEKQMLICKVFFTQFFANFLTSLILSSYAAGRKLTSETHKSLIVKSTPLISDLIYFNYLSPNGFKAGCNIIRRFLYLASCHLVCVSFTTFFFKKRKNIIRSLTCYEGMIENQTVIFIAPLSKQTKI